MEALAYQTLKQMVLAKGFVFYEEPQKLNRIWFRTNQIFTNMFTDTLYIAYIDEAGEEMVVLINGTTKASLYGVGGATNPIPGGEAVIMGGQYEDVDQFIDGGNDGTGRAPWGKSYFYQIKGMNYWRDCNKDNQIDQTNPQYNKIFHTNEHIMSEPLSRNLPKNLPWSEGCTGYGQDDMENKVAPLARNHIKLYGNTFTRTILEA